MSLRLDHLVLGTDDLSRGAAQLANWFGVDPFGGGEHELFATHNKLWRLEAAHYPLYLELIAVNPAAVPRRKRWFGLDEVHFAPDEIRPIGMVARCDNIEETAQHFGADRYEIVPLSRGDLRWQFGLQRRAYQFPGDVPDLIEWKGRHPLDHVPVGGLRLEQVVWPADSALALDWPCATAAGASRSFGVKLRTHSGQAVQF